MGRICAECRPSAANETDSPRRRGDAEKAKSKPQRTRRSTKEVVIARIRKTLPLMNSGTDFREQGKHLPQRTQRSQRQGRAEKESRLYIKLSNSPCSFIHASCPGLI